MGFVAVVCQDNVFEKCFFHENERRKIGRKATFLFLKLVVPWDFTDGIKVVK